MQSSWLSATNFERMYQILSAINIVSINIKLQTTDIQDIRSAELVKKARHDLIEFLTKFNELIESSKTEEDTIVVASDPRIEQLIRSYLERKHRKGDDTNPFCVPLVRMIELLNTSEQQTEDVLAFLSEFGDLIESQTVDDVQSMLGEL